MRRVYRTEAEESTKQNSGNQQTYAQCELAVFPNERDERITDGTLPDLVQ